jgi:hypothetical protein
LPVPRTRRRRHLALATALGLHLLLATGVLHWRVPAPPAAPAERRSTVVMVSLPKPKPPPKKIPKPATSGVKLAARPSPGLPSAKTIEHQLATLPHIDLEPNVAQAVVTDPLPNLAAIDVASSEIGTGGTGRTGAGAGSKGTGTGGTGTPNLFEECADTPDRAMVADVYRLPKGSDSVHAMDRRKPIKRVCLAQLDITPRSFREGFPGMDGLIEWFGLDIRFTVKIAEPGMWDLALMSDDGAILSIDDTEVINNDGLHGPVGAYARVRLAAGARRFRVRYFQGPREHIALVLVWRRAGEKELQYISQEVLGRPPVEGK